MSSPPRRSRRQAGAEREGAGGPARRPPVARRSAVGHFSLGGEQVEGRRAVRELLLAGRRPVRDVWISEVVEPGPLVAEIEQLAAAGAVPVRHVPRARLEGEARTEAPQGVLAHARGLESVELEALCRRRGTEPPPFLLLLDGLTDPQNLGSLLRTAEVAGVTGLVLPRHRSVHVTPAVTKAAAGAVEYVPIALVGGIAAALTLMNRAGVWSVGLDASAGESLFGLALGTEPVAMVLGAEGVGLSRLVSERCDLLVGIPQNGSLGSLNVAVAGALAMFEVARARMLR